MDVSERLMNSTSCTRCSASEAETKVDSSPGYYAIFLDMDRADNLEPPFYEILRTRGTDLLYVGIAEKTGLRKRLVDQDLHHRNPSTFFRSLGAVLGYRPPPAGLRGNNYKFSPQDTEKIVDWIKRALRVHWVSEGPAILAEEKSAIRVLCPLLNIKHNPKRIPELKELRRKCTAIARQPT
jgi:hypothetical protein